MKLLIKGGQLVDTMALSVTLADVLVEDGLVTALGANLAAEDAKIIDATDQLVCPGLIDMHVHLREPGFEAKETIATGTRAAARGGFTGVACMPNTNPVADNAAIIRAIIDKAQDQGVVDVYPIAAITKDSLGKEITEMGDLKLAGAVALSDDGEIISDAAVMRRAMQYAAMFDLPVLPHCEDKNLVQEGLMNEGYYSTVLGLQGNPALAEEIMVARDIALADNTGCALHITHISTAGAVELVRQAKKRDMKITCEATPHHFTLTDQAVVGYNTFTKVSPPLRTADDVAAIKAGLADGTIDVIATDHAPHTIEEKMVEYQYAPAGMVGLETAVGLVFTELVVPGILTPAQAIAKLSVAPAAILGLAAGQLKIGERANITVIDPKAKEIVNPDQFASKGVNTPFAGKELQAVPTLTIVGGKIVMQNRQLL